MGEAQEETRWKMKEFERAGLTVRRCRACGMPKKRLRTTFSLGGSIIITDSPLALK